MFNNKKILVLGMARSGYEAAKLLISMNNQVILNDKNDNQNSDHVQELKKLGIEVILGEHPKNLIDQTFDYIVKNPGVPLNHVYVIEAEKYNIPVINEVELAFHLLPQDINIIGITGSNGKTTTTTIIYEILKKANFSVHLMGNIGFPVSSFVKKVKPKDTIVMEVSIQQLCNVNKFKTNMAVLTNLYEAHLDFVGSYQNYINIKKRIFNYHTSRDVAILNSDNEDVIKITNDISSEKLYFSTQKETNSDSYIKDNAIYYYNNKIIDISDIKIKGIHNYENIMAAIIVAKKLNVSDKLIQEVLKTFNGVEHRIEFIKEINGINFYNDSKSTNIKATQIALSSFYNDTILLLGGLDRGHSFEGLKSYLNHVKSIIAYGETKERIKAFAESRAIKCLVVETLDEATQEAYKIAGPQNIVLLSPACASWDQFKDFEERGRKFKEIVNKLELKG